MWATNPVRLARRPGLARAAGTFIVEFAMVLLVFFLFVFGVMELARAQFLWNTLPEVTRRAASAAAAKNFRDPAAMAAVRQNAVFRTSPGLLILGDPLTEEHVKIDYMALTRSSDGTLSLAPIDDSALPTSTAQNRIKCMADPNDAGCIRFVRVRICSVGSTDNCGAVTYKTIMPLITLAPTFPASTTIVPAGSLGYEPGMTP
jgi:Flp pilus assembly protein TadG